MDDVSYAEARLKYLEIASTYWVVHVREIVAEPPKASADRPQFFGGVVAVTLPSNHPQDSRARISKQEFPGFSGSFDCLRSRFAARTVLLGLLLHRPISDLYIHRVTGLSHD